MESRKRLDPVKTRDAIFAAAISLFAEKGYEGTSIADVAQAAGVQKSLVQYHFGSKFGLWSAAIGDRTRPMLAMLERAASGEAEVRDLVAARFEMLRRNPEMTRILAWLALQGLPIPAPIAEKRETLRSIAIGKGGIRMDLLLGLCAVDGWMHNKHMYAAVLGETVLEPETEERLIRQVLKQMDRMACEAEFAKALATFLEEQS